jgi:hypothetical protein
MASSAPAGVLDSVPGGDATGDILAIDRAVYLPIISTLWT